MRLKHIQREPNMYCRSFLAVTVLLFILCTGMASVEAVSIRERCECLHTVDRLPWRQIVDIQVTPRNPLCNSVQIVVEMQSKAKICLNPDLRQGQRIQKCWERRKNPDETENCLPLPPKK